MQRVPATSVRQFAIFGAVGVLGFAADATVFTIVNAGLDNLYASRVVSYLAAATLTWFLNRTFTFRSRGESATGQWARFLALQTAGGAVNYAVYALLITVSPAFAAFPVAAIAAGSLSGMGVNFLTAKFLVFERRAP